MPDEPAPAAAAPVAAPTPSGGGFLERASARVAAAFQQGGDLITASTPAVAPAAAPTVPETPPVVATPAAAVVPAVEPAKPAVEKIEPEIEPVKVDDLGLPLGALGEEATTEEVPPAGEEDPNAPQDPKAARAFKTLRTELTAANAAVLAAAAERDQLRAQLEEFKATNPDVEGLKAKVTEYENLLSVTRLQSSPAYIEAVEKPYQAIITKADEIAAQYELDKIELSNALSIPDRKERTKALSALLTGVDETDRLDVHDLGREVEKIAAKERDLIANADKALKELEAEAENVQKQEIAKRVAERKDTVAKVIPYMAGKLPTFRTAIEGLSEKLATTDLLAVPTAELVYNAAAGELVPTIIKQLNQVQRDLEAALEENEKFRRSSPGGGPGAAPAGPAVVDAKEGFQSRVTKRLSAAGMAS